MLRELGHDHPAAFSETGELILVDNGKPFADPPEFDNDEERAGARKAAEFILQLLGRKLTVAKLAVCGSRCTKNRGQWSG